MLQIICVRDLQTETSVKTEVFPIKIGTSVINEI